MATTKTQPAGESRLIDTIEEAEHSSLEAVRRFLDTVDGAFPDLTSDDNGPRRKIIDSAFKMTEQLLASSNDLARKVLDLTESALNDSEDESDG